MEIWILRALTFVLALIAAWLGSYVKQNAQLRAELETAREKALRAKQGENEAGTPVWIREAKKGVLMEILHEVQTLRMKTTDARRFFGITPSKTADPQGTYDEAIAAGEEYLESGAKLRKLQEQAKLFCSHAFVEQIDQVGSDVIAIMDVPHEDSEQIENRTQTLNKHIDQLATLAKDELRLQG